MNRKLRTASVAVALILALLLAGCGSRQKTKAAAPDVGFLADESYLMDYTVQDGKVQIRCVLNLVNRGKEPCIIRIYGDFPNDVGTLLTQERLSAVDGETGSDTFTLAPGEVTQVGVVFTGDFGGKMVKADRLLPTLLWAEAEDPGEPQPLQAYTRNKG